MKVTITKPFEYPWKKHITHARWDYKIDTSKADFGAVFDTWVAGWMEGDRFVPAKETRIRYAAQQEDNVFPEGFFMPDEIEVHTAVQEKIRASMGNIRLEETIE